MAGTLIDFSLLLDLGLILLSATLFNYIARFLKQPNLLAYLVAGIFLGPMVLGAMDISILGFNLGIHSFEDVLLLSELGVAFLLFGVGVETDFTKLMELGKTAFLGGIIQVLVTLLTVVIGFQLIGFLSLEQSIYVGLILAFSSTLIVVKILNDNHQMNTLQGRLMIGFLLVQDLLIVLVMPFITSTFTSFDFTVFLPVLARGVLIITFAYLLNKAIYPTMYKFAAKNNELMFLASLSSAFVFILLAVGLEFPIAVGAFIAGVSLSTLPYNLEVFNQIRGVRDFFATIFFVTLGIQISFNFTAIPLPIILLVLIIVFLLKPIIFYLITLLSGYGGEVSVLVALGLAQVSEFSFILANLSKDALNQTPGLYSFLLIVIAGSMVLSPYFNKYSRNFYHFTDAIVNRIYPKIKDNKLVHRKIRLLESIPEEFQNHIIIIGAGTMGYNIAKTLNQKELIIVDHNPDTIYDSILKGMHAVYGEADNLEVLEKVKLNKAKLLILSLPEIKAAINATRYAKKNQSKNNCFCKGALLP
ncbi:MAG: cation:proton antiporter [Candidatus Diapherotrites archaeon]